MGSPRPIGLFLVLAALAGCGGSDDPDQLGSDVTPNQLVLQLSDVPRGYTVGDDSSCDESGAPGSGSISVEGGTPRYRELILAERPSGCYMQLERLYDGADPPRIDSMALVFAADEGAEAGFDIADEVLAYVTGEEDLRPAPLAVELGDEAKAFSTDDALVEGETGQPGGAIVWRDGPVLAAVLTGGIGGQAGKRATLALAERQQRRIEAPPTIEPAEQDDREVALDNPDLGIPIYWLGRDFSPSGGLPEIHLYEASGPYGPGESPGNLVKIDYTRAVNIDLWERAKWERFLPTRLGRLVWDSPCTRETNVQLAGGHAVVYAGYAARGPGRRALARAEVGRHERIRPSPRVRDVRTNRSTAT